MSLIANMKIGVRLGIGFGVTLTLLIIMATVSYLRLGVLNDEIMSMVDDKFPKTVQASDMGDAIDTIARQLRNAYIFSGAEQQKALDAIPEQRKIITDRIEKLEKTVTSDKGKEVLKKVTTARTAYVAAQDKFIELLKAAKRDEIVALLQGDLRKAQEEYRGAIDALIDFQTQLMKQAGTDAGQLADAAMLAEAAVAGKLATHADASKHQGDFNRVVAGVNHTPQVPRCFRTSSGGNGCVQTPASSSNRSDGIVFTSDIAFQ